MLTSQAIEESVADETGRRNRVLSFLCEQFSLSYCTLSLKYLAEEYQLRFAVTDSVKELVDCVHEQDVFAFSKSTYGLVVSCSIVPTVETRRVLRTFYESLLLRLSDFPTENSCNVNVLSAYMTEASVKLTDCSLLQFLKDFDDTFVVKMGDVADVCLHSSTFKKHLSLYLRKYFIGMKAFSKDAAIPLGRVYEHLSTRGPLAIRNQLGEHEALGNLRKFIDENNLQYSTAETGAIHLAPRQSFHWDCGLEQAARYFHQIMYAFKLCGHSSVCFNVLMSCVKVAREPVKSFLQTEFPNMALIDFFQCMPEYFDTLSTFNCVSAVSNDIPEAVVDCSNLEILVIKHFVTLLWVATVELNMEVLQLCLQYADEKVRRYCFNEYPEGIADFFQQYESIFKVSEDGHAVKLRLDLPKFCASSEVSRENYELSTQAAESDCNYAVQQVIEGTCLLRRYDLLCVFLKRRACFQFKNDKVLLCDWSSQEPSSPKSNPSSAEKPSFSVMEGERDVPVDNFRAVSQCCNLPICETEKMVHKDQVIQEGFDEESFKPFRKESVSGTTTTLASMPNSSEGELQTKGHAKGSHLSLDKQAIIEERHSSSKHMLSKNLGIFELLKIQTAVETFDDLITEVLRPLEFCAVGKIEKIAQQANREDFDILQSHYTSGFVGYLTTQCHIFEPSNTKKSIKLCKEYIGGRLKSKSCVATVADVALGHCMIRAEHFQKFGHCPRWPFAVAHGCSGDLESCLRVGDRVEIQYLYYTEDSPFITSVIKIENPDKANASPEVRECSVLMAGPYYTLLGLKRSNGSADRKVTIVYANTERLKNLMMGDTVNAKVKPGYPSARIWKAYELSCVKDATGANKSVKHVQVPEQKVGVYPSSKVANMAATTIRSKASKGKVLHAAVAYFVDVIGCTGSEASKTTLEDALNKSPKPVKEFFQEKFPNNFLDFFRTYTHAFSMLEGDRVKRTLPMKLTQKSMEDSTQDGRSVKSTKVVSIRAKGNSNSPNAGTHALAEVKQDAMSSFSANGTTSTPKLQPVTQKAPVQEVHPIQTPSTRTAVKRDMTVTGPVTTVSGTKLYEILEVNATQTNYTATTTNSPFIYALRGSVTGLWEQGMQISTKNFPGPTVAYPWAFVQQSGVISMKMTSEWRLGDTVEFDGVYNAEQQSMLVTCIIKVSGPISDVPPKSCTCEVALVTTYYALLKLVLEENESIPENRVVLLFSDPRGIRLVPFQRVVAEVVPNYPSPELWKVCSLMKYDI